MTDPTPPPTAQGRARKPWPMVWVVAAIAGFIVVHTLVNLASRKPAPAHQPAAEARDRQRHFVQADMKGWTRYAARLAPPAAPIATSRDAAVAREPAPERLAVALPFDLVGIFTSDPRLHAAPASINAAADLPDDGVLYVRLHFAPSETPVAFGEALAFAKDHHLYLFLQDETRTMLDEPPTPFAAALELSLPPKVLSTGEWQVSLYTKDAVFSWRVAVE